MNLIPPAQRVYTGVVRTVVICIFVLTIVFLLSKQESNALAGDDTINQAPSFTVGANQITNEDSGPQSVPWATNITAGPPSESGQTLTFLVIANTNPGLFSVGPAISSTGTLTYTPAANEFGSATIDVVLKDDGGTAFGGQDTSPVATFSITVNHVNDVPSFTKGPDQTINEDAGFQFITNWPTNITAGPNESGQSLTFFVTGNTNPSLFSLPPSVNPSGTLIYTPAFHANGSATITIALKDDGGTDRGGQDTSAEQTFTITVNAVNDAPVNQFPPSPVAFQNTPLVFSPATFNAISVTDIDAGNDPISVGLTAQQGTLSLSGVTGLTFVTGDGTDDAAVTFIGTIADINAALNGLTFKPPTGFSGSVNIQIMTNDQGHNGSGGAQTDTDTMPVNVRSGGVLQFSSATYTALEDFGFVGITVTRTGGNGGAASVSFSTTSGTATGGSTCSSGIDFENRSGTLSWVNNEVIPKTFLIEICDDSLIEANETITLTLSDPTGSASLGTQTTATLNITSDDHPVLLTEEDSDRAIALDSVTLKRDPFALINEFALGADNHRRVSFFVWGMGLLPSDTAANVTAMAEDDVGTPYPLTVEFVGPVVGLDDVTQVVVKLPDNVQGMPRDLFVRITLRGPGTNAGRISISGP